VLHIYNWADYFGKDAIAEFERTTGIRVEYDTSHHTPPGGTVTAHAIRR